MFGEKYFYQKGVEGYTLEFQHRRFKRYVKLLLREGVSVDSRILDIGCGFGIFLRLCNESGFRSYGVDISKYAIEIAKKLRAGCLLIGDGTMLPFKTSSFDIVVMFDLVEHLKFPHQALKEANRVLKFDGFLVLTTPNLESLSRIIRGRRWWAFKDSTHVSLFTKESLKKLMYKSGFKVSRLQTITSLPALGILLRKTGQDHFGIKLLELLYHIPDILLRKTGFAGNIWLVARKMSADFPEHCIKSVAYSSVT